MRFVWERKFLLGMAAVLVFSAIMAVRQVIENQSHHAELREAFIFLHNKGYNTEAERLFVRLKLEIQSEPTRYLIDDMLRMSMIAPTNQSASTNLLVRFHVSVRKELDKRFEEEYLKARNLSQAAY